MLCLVSAIKSASAQEYVILRVILNEYDKGEFFCLLNPDQDIWLKRKDLTDMGFNNTIGGEVMLYQEAYVPLSSISDLEFLINEREVTLEITAASHLFTGTDIDVHYGRPRDVRYTGTGSVFFNYAGTYIDESKGSYLDLSGELGISIDDYFGRSTFSYQKTDEEDRAVRLETSLTINNRKNLRTTTFGDVPALSGPLGSGTLLGGVTISRNFSIDPYFIRFPSLDVKGTLETPSEVEIYLDGLLVKRERLSPGEFVFRDVPATVGLGTAEIIINDAYGREKRISTPYYYTDRLLQKGLHEYSYSLGFIREDFGEKSFSYGNAAFLSFHRYGYSNNLTLGYAAEATNDGMNVGPTASFLVSKAGTIDLAFAVSRSEGDYGVSGLLGYTFQSRHISARLALRADSEAYSTNALRPSDDKAKVQLDTAIGFGVKKAGSFTLAYSLSDMYLTETSSQILLSFNKAITEKSTLFINAHETKNSETEYEVLVGLHMNFGKDMSGNVSYRGREDADDKRVRVQKNLPLGAGYGFRADMENTRDRNNYEASLQYQNDYGIYELGYRDRLDNEGYRLSLSGGIGYIDRSFFLSRPILDSYAKVKVGELEGVRTYYYGNEVGRTNSRGEIIVPTMHSFYENKIDIEVKDIPLNYSISSLTQYISPPFRSGSLVHFDVSKIQGIVGTIYALEEGREIPVEAAVMLVETEDKTVRGLVGTGGEFYLENVPQGAHPALVTYKERECHFHMNIPYSEEMILDLGKIICEVTK